MIPGRLYFPVGGGGIPRESGDDPGVGTFGQGLNTYSPRERG